MSDLSAESNRRERLSARRGSGPADLLRRLWRAYWAWQVRRATVRLLDGLDDHVLRDLGISREDIRHYAGGGDPAWARGRRLPRR